MATSMSPGKQRENFFIIGKVIVACDAEHVLRIPNS